MLKRRFLTVCILVIALIVMNISPAFALSNNTTVQKYTDNDGVVWTLSITTDGDDTSISLKSEDATDDKYVIESNLDEGEIVLSTYEYEECHFL
jgi:hypothetical protein